ncbi:MAG TPA: tetratricopeptide repeat protein, partial [Polyangia bacterium]|nr:tetratricopeptide repeat protein [Polyangia bacterium]
MVRTHGLLWTDPFSSGAAGRPWVDVHWLFQIAAYLVQAAAGLAGLVVVKCALVAAGALVLHDAVARARAARPVVRGFFSLAFAGALFLTRHLLLLRPVIPTLLLLALFFRQLEAFRRHGRPRALVALPLLQIVWANVQGLSALGPALVAAYLAGAGVAHLGRRRWPALARNETDGAPDASGARFRALGVCLILCLLACLCTPFGLRGPILAGKLLLRLLPVAENVYSSNIVENVPPWSLDRAMRAEFWHFGYGLALFVAALCLGWRRLPPSHGLLAAALIGLSLVANRNVLLLYWLGVPIATLSLAPDLRAARAWARRRWARRRPWRWRVAIGAGAALPIALSALVVTAARRETTIRQPAPWRACVRSADILDGEPGPGTIFAADNWGGYLIWRLYPRFRPYMDTRLVLRSADEFAEYLALADEPASFDAWAQRFHFDYVALPTAYPDRYLGLVAHLAASPDWSLVFTDGTEVLFAHAGASERKAWDLQRRATTLRILADLEARFGRQPRVHAAARLQLAILDLAVGAAAESEVSLDDLSTPDAALIRAHARLAQGDAAGAEAIAFDLLRLDARHVAALDLLASIAVSRGDVAGAVAYLRRALAIEPDDPEALRMLLDLELGPGGRH